MVQDDDGSLLPVMTTRDVRRLIKHFAKNDNDKTQEKLEDLDSRIGSGQLHVVWIKLPDSKAMRNNEVRTIRLTYSPHQARLPNSVLKIGIKKQPYPLYYTLFTPAEFDFARTQYSTIKDDKMEQGHASPRHVQKFKTNNSVQFRIPSETEKGLEISYSFKPKTASVATMKMVLAVLTAMSFAVAMLKYVVFLGEPPDTGIFAKQVEIGLFVIGGSLLLPQLIGNQSIRARYTWWYLIPIGLGILILA